MSSTSASFRTLEKKAPEFESYLRGTFSKKERALPVKSLNVNTDQESVTFQIVPLSEIKRPSYFTIWMKAFRPRSFLMVLFPMFVVASKNIVDNVNIDSMTLILATLGVLFLYAAFNLRNDYVDHMKGFDRIDLQLGSRPIQAGWLTAETVRKVANLFIILSFILAFPIFIAVPPILLFVAIALLISYLVLFRLRVSFKEIAGGELGIFLLVGPLLTSGYELSFTGVIRPETVVIGLIWGGMALMPIHLRNLELIVSQSQAGLHNMVNYFGFDKAKRFIAYWWILCLGGFVGYHFEYSGFFWCWFYTCFMAFVSILFFQDLSFLQSPAGSRMLAVRKRGDYLLVFIMALWVVEMLGYLLYEF